MPVPWVFAAWMLLSRGPCRSGARYCALLRLPFGGGGTRFSQARIPVLSPQSGASRLLLFDCFGGARDRTRLRVFLSMFEAFCGRGPLLRRAF